jgi:hypothetical protein
MEIFLFIAMIIVVIGACLRFVVELIGPWPTVTLLLGMVAIFAWADVQITRAKCLESKDSKRK